MAKNKAKKAKQQVMKKPQNKVEKKLKKKKLQKTLAVPPKLTPPTNDSDSDESESESDKVHKLLEPYTKDQLIDFMVDAAISDASLFNRIRDAADRDVSHRKIFVFGLGWDTTRETLVSALESFGEIEDCNVVIDRVTGRAKGFAFVLFKSRQSAIKALKQPRKKINNRMASCQLASIGPAAATQQIQDSSGRKIYVSNVQAEVDPEKMRLFFSKFGEIELGPIGFDMQTGKSRGFALFVYKTVEGARKALEEPYKIFEGHQLHCQKATDGKNKVGPGPPAAAVSASVTTAVQPMQSPVLAAMAAAQNMALFGQHHPNLNPIYSAMLGNPNAGFMAPAGSGNPLVGAGGLSQGVPWTSQGGAVSLGSVPTGFGGYGASTSHGLGGLGGNSSVLGAYGSSGSTLQSLHQAYQNQSSQMGQPSSAKAPGIGGSFSGYPSYM